MLNRHSVFVALAIASLVILCVPNQLTPMAQTTGDCTITLTGDMNEDGVINSADVIFMVNCAFRDCLGTCWAIGDVNCNGSMTSADIIYLVRYIFAGGPEPCDVCTIIDQWYCGHD